MSFIPYEVITQKQPEVPAMERIVRIRMTELPVAETVQEARNIISNLPHHLRGRHIEYHEEGYGLVTPVK